MFITISTRVKLFTILFFSGGFGVVDGYLWARTKRSWTSDFDFILLAPWFAKSIYQFLFRSLSKHTSIHTNMHNIRGEGEICNISFCFFFLSSLCGQPEKLKQKEEEEKRVHKNTSTSHKPWTVVEWMYFAGRIFYFFLFFFFHFPEIKKSENFFKTFFPQWCVTNKEWHSKRDSRIILWNSFNCKMLSQSIFLFSHSFYFYVFKIQWRRDSFMTSRSTTFII